MIFLVDSGAERTVLRDIKGVPKGSDSVRVLAANGKITRNPVSKTIYFSLPGDETIPPVGLKVVLASECPHNLLGRDLLLHLGLSIGPGPDGVLVVKKHTFDCMVVEGTVEPHYYWSLDLSENDPSRAPKYLLDLAKRHTTSKDTDYMSEDQLHMTLRFKIGPGPDPEYDQIVHKLGPQSLTVTYLYFDGSTTLCDVETSNAARLLMPKYYQRHISLGKHPLLEWKDLGPKRASVTSITDWERSAEDPKIEHSVSTGWNRLALNIRVKTTPQTHLTDE